MQGYGTPIRRRSGDSGWTWLGIGIVLGVGCSLVMCLTTYVMGFIEFKAPDSEKGETVVIESTQTATATPQVIITTSVPTIATMETPADSEETESDATAPAVSTATLEATPLASTGGTPGTELLDEEPTVASAESQEAGSEETTAGEVATEVSAGGSPTQTPAIGGVSTIPESLLNVASPMVEIPGGTFTMGTTQEEALTAVDQCTVRDAGTCTVTMTQDSTPAHQVTLDTFQIELYEVSVTQYVAFLNYLLQLNPGTRVDRVGCGGQPCILVEEDDPQSYIRFTGVAYEAINAFYATHPVTYVTWWGADEYCRTIGRRLPTEAEWERAARGPKNSLYPWGPEWIPENAKLSRPTTDGTVPVDAYPNGASDYGPYNMSGNVSEWVFDWYQENYYSLPEAAGPNPQGASSGETKVMRGGGWDNVPLFGRSVHRMESNPGTPRSSLGFRCAGSAG